MKELQPVGDRITVERLEAEDRTEGGILIPSVHQEKPLRGRILRMGEAMPEGYELLEPGDIVLFGKFAGTEVPGYDNLLIMKAEEVLAYEMADDDE